jgi:Carboxypeptidase regulatory-like domain
MRSFILRTWFVVLIISASCFAQSESKIATITGTVTDTTGAVIPKSKVTLEPTNGPPIQAITDNAGHFEISAAPGEYILTASAVAFRATKKAVHLSAVAPTIENIPLPLADGGCGVCVEPVPALETLSEPLDLLLPLSLLPPYKFPARTSKHLHI